MSRIKFGFTLGDVLIREQGRALRAAQAKVGQSHGGGQGEGDGEPGQSAGYEAPHSLQI